MTLIETKMTRHDDGGFTLSDLILCCGDAIYEATYDKDGWIQSASYTDKLGRTREVRTNLKRVVAELVEYGRLYKNR